MSNMFKTEAYEHLRQVGRGWYYGLKQRFWAPDDFLLPFMAGVATCSNILLKSYPGKGKTSLAEHTSNYFGVDMGRVQGNPGLDETQFVATYDLGKLVREGVEVPVWRPFMDAFIKHFDEINRVSPHTLNVLLSVLAGEEAFFGTHRREIEKHVFIATMNPAGDGTFRYDDAALWDRFDICLVNRSLTARELSDLQNNERGVRDPMPVGACKADIFAMKEFIEKMPFEKGAMEYASIAVRATSACRFGEKEELKNFPACCKNCELSNGTAICSEVTPLSPRVITSVARIAAGIAFMEGRQLVEKRHINMAIPNVIRHRITFVQQSEDPHLAIDIDRLVKKMGQLVQEVHEARKKASVDKAAMKKFQQSPNPLISEEIEALKNELNQGEKTIDNMTTVELREVIGSGVASPEDVAKAQQYLEARKVIGIKCTLEQIESEHFWAIFQSPDGEKFMSDGGWEHLLMIKETDPDQVDLPGLRMQVRHQGTDSSELFIILDDGMQADTYRDFFENKIYNGEALDVLPVTLERRPEHFPIMDVKGKR